MITSVTEIEICFDKRSIHCWVLHSHRRMGNLFVSSLSNIESPNFDMITENELFFDILGMKIRLL